MFVTITNNIKIEEPTYEVLKWIKENLIVDNPTYQNLKILGKEDLIRFKHVPETLNLYYEKHNCIIVPFGCLYALWMHFKDSDYKLILNETKTITVANSSPTLPLYDYQEEAVNAMLKAKGGILVAPCGSGKTICGIEIIRRIGKKALWLCHTGDLLRQAKDDMLSQYPDIKLGLTTKGKLEIGEDVTISTIQTMDKIDPELYKDAFDIVIVDECAHVSGSPTQMKMFQRVISHIPARYKYGLTATPARSDGMIKAMYAYVGLSPKGEFKPTFKVDKTRIKTIVAEHRKIDIDSGYDDFKMMDLYDSSGMLVYNNLISSLTENEERTEKILDYIEECDKEGRKQVVLASRVEHCENIVKKLNDRGINAVLCVGKTTAKKRSQILKQEIDWDVLVSTYALLKEGVSIKELDTLHLVTPIKDKSTVVQCAGRIERYLPNKKQPVIYDYVDIDIPYCEKSFTGRRRSLNSRF